MASAATIHSLYLDDNPIAFLPDVLSKNQNMRHLTVSNTQVPHIPHDILHLPKLSLLETANNRLDPQLQMAALRGVDELRKAYDKFIPNAQTSAHISAVQLRRNASSADQNGSREVEKRSSKALENAAEKRRSKTLEKQPSTESEKRSSFVLGYDNNTLSLEKKRSPRGDVAPQENPLSREGKGSLKNKADETREDKTSPRESTLPRGQQWPPPSSRQSDNPYPINDARRLPRTNLENGGGEQQETNNNTLEKPKPSTKPKPPLHAKPVTGVKPEVSAKPHQVNGGGQKSSFLFSRPN